MWLVLIWLDKYKLHPEVVITIVKQYNNISQILINTYSVYYTVWTGNGR